MVDHQTLIQRVVGAFQRGSCIPILGAGCSASQRSPSGVLSKGYPVSSEFLEYAKEGRSYLAEVGNFYDANILIEQNEGKQALSDLLVKHYSGVRDLPSYQVLASLPFDTALSFNFDESFESSLRKVGKSPNRIIEDRDVPSAAGASINLLKPHGTISHQSSLRATRNSVGRFEQESQLFCALLRVLFAQKDLLFVGYGMGDEDFLASMRWVKNWIGDQSRRSTAILRRVSPALEAELNELDVDFIVGEAVAALSEVAAELAQKGQPGTENPESWRIHPFFSDLVHIRSQPSETQVIESLLNATHERLESFGVRDACRAASEAAKLCLEYRPNYAGLNRLIGELGSLADRASDSDAWDGWRDYTAARQSIRQNLSGRAAEAIGVSTAIMLYSQSQRVLDLVNELEPTKRRELKIIIPECRAKSLVPFENAALIADKLKNSNFDELVVALDVIAQHMILNNQVDLVLMGVHKVFVVEGSATPIGVVNAVGSAAVCELAYHHEIRVGFVYESDKVVVVDTESEALESVNYDPECDHYPALVNAHSDVDHLAMFQVGYDYIPWRTNFFRVSDSGN